MPTHSDVVDIHKTRTLNEISEKLGREGRLTVDEFFRLGDEAWNLPRRYPEMEAEAGCSFWELLLDPDYRREAGIEFQRVACLLSWSITFHMEKGYQDDERVYRLANQLRDYLGVLQVGYVRPDEWLGRDFLGLCRYIGISPFVRRWLSDEDAENLLAALAAEPSKEAIRGMFADVLFKSETVFDFEVMIDGTYSGQPEKEAEILQKYLPLLMISKMYPARTDGGPPDPFLALVPERFRTAIRQAIESSNAIGVETRGAMAFLLSAGESEDE